MDSVRPPSATLIISFYKKIGQLRIILAALERQSFRNFEVIVADDGSPQSVVTELKSFIATLTIPVKHVWHEDIGFRKTRILNVAVRESGSNYLIFIDGDCIPHRDFVLEHVRNHERNTILAGRRVNLSEALSAKLTEEDVRKGFLEKQFRWLLFRDALAGKTTHAEKGIYIRSSFLRKFLNRKMTGLLGCNFSIYKEDLQAINGFDERYEAPAVGEDTDIELRFTWHGGKIRMIKNMAIQYHLYHKKLPRPDKNQELFALVKAERKSYTPFGLRQDSPKQNH